MYRQLSEKETIKTLNALHMRIEERFPNSGLGRICNELCSVANESAAKILEIRKPKPGIRIGVGILSLIILFTLAYSISLMELSFRNLSFGKIVQIAEAAINDVILIGAALFFLVTFENRVKRFRTLNALHELRAIAHVIDMHQLTKDPSLLLVEAILTQASPKKQLSKFELIRYLDYCSEMLALTGKVAALYAQNFQDSVVLSTVNELENLTSGLSRKIWQKIMILHRTDAQLHELSYETSL